MRVFVTGGTGFIGATIVRELRQRGDDVVCLVRSREKGVPLADLGCKVVPGDLSDVEPIKAGIDACDAVIHCAAIYQVGVPKGRHAAMYEANVVGTETVLRAALEAKIPKVVYVSTVAAFGNTHGEVVDETYRHPGDSYTSYYEQTKVKAHQIARRLIDDEGLPCVIVQPGGVYGPGDHSELGNTMDQVLKGRLPLIPFPDTGMNMVYVDDVAQGVLLALDKGQPGEAYVLGGQITTMRELLQTVARTAGRKPPRRALPTLLVKASAPFGRLIGPVLGFPPNMGEMIRSSDGVTFWARHDKAIEQLGYSPRGLEQGLHDMLEAEGRLPAAA